MIDFLSNTFVALMYLAGVIGLVIVICYMILLALGFMYWDEDEDER